MRVVLVFFLIQKDFMLVLIQQTLPAQVDQRSDIQIGAFRLYEDYLNSQLLNSIILILQIMDLKEDIRPPTAFAYQLTASVPSADLLAINWNFDTVTGSNASGDFIVDDFSSGSTDTIYGWIDNIIRREHRGEVLILEQAKLLLFQTNLFFSKERITRNICYI
jgi:hypothetical protein